MQISVKEYKIWRPADLRGRNFLVKEWRNRPGDAVVVPDVPATAATESATAEPTAEPLATVAFEELVEVEVALNVDR